MKELLEHKKRLKELRNRITETYKQTMPNIYKEYKDVPSDVIRLELLRVVSQNAINKSIARIRRKNRKPKRILIDKRNELEAVEQDWK